MVLGGSLGRRGGGRVEFRFHARSEYVNLQSTNWEVPQTLSLTAFIVVSLHRHGWLSHWPLAMKNLQPWKVPTL